MAVQSRRKSLSTPLKPLLSAQAQCSNPISESTSESARFSTEHIELLFAHPFSKVVSFTFSPSALLDGLLSWGSPSERTIASGPLRIYKTIPHNIAFLQSGSALKPLLSRTQCWNVDGKNTFCLQLRPGNYWRIEFLGDDGEQITNGARFRDAMANIVAFEVTVCPFIRAEECAPGPSTPVALQPAKVWRRPALRGADANVSVKSVSQFNFDNRDRAHNAKCTQKAEWDPTKSSGTLSIWETNSLSRGPSARSRSIQHYSSPVTYQPRISSLPLRQNNDKPLEANCFVSIADRRSIPRESSMLRIEQTGKRHGSQVDDKAFFESLSPVKHSGHELNDVKVDQSIVAVDDTFTNLPYDSPIKLREVLDETESPTVLRPPSLECGLEKWKDFAFRDCSTKRHSNKPFGVDLPLVDYSDGIVKEIPSHQSSRPQTPSCWHTPKQQLAEFDICEPKGGDSVDISVTHHRLSSALSTRHSSSGSQPDGSEFEYDSGSGSESDSDFKTKPDIWSDVDTSRPSPLVLLDPHTSSPNLRHVASALVLSKTADMAAATANYVVLKPSVFLINMMFSIAANLANRVVSGAGYTMAECEDQQGYGWDECDDNDDYQLCPSTPKHRRNSSTFSDEIL